MNNYQLTFKQAQELLACSKTTLENWIRMGKVKCVKEKREGDYAPRLYFPIDIQRPQKHNCLKTTPLQMPTMQYVSTVNPSHYASHKVTPIDLIESYRLNFNCGNVIKYTARAKEKNGREDLIKAVWYLLNELNVPRDEISEFTEKLTKAGKDEQLP